MKNRRIVMLNYCSLLCGTSSEFTASLHMLLSLQFFIYLHELQNVANSLRPCFYAFVYPVWSYP